MTEPAFLTRPGIVSVLVQEIGQGSHPHTAAMKAGVKPKDLDAWLERGRAEKDPVYTDFAAKIDKALAEYERMLSEILHAAVSGAKPDVSTARWLLERRFPKRWRAKDPGEEVIPVKSDGRAYTPEELRTAAEIQEAAAARMKARVEAERRGSS